MTNQLYTQAIDELTEVKARYKALEAELDAVKREKAELQRALDNAQAIILRQGLDERQRVAHNLAQIPGGPL